MKKINKIVAGLMAGTMALSTFGLVGCDITSNDSSGEESVVSKDGREVEFQKSETHIEWRYVGETEWKQLIAIDELKGNDGKDGREVEYKNDGTYILWRYVGEDDEAWRILTALDKIQQTKPEIGVEITKEEFLEALKQANSPMLNFESEVKGSLLGESFDAKVKADLSSYDYNFNDGGYSSFIGRVEIDFGEKGYVDRSSIGNVTGEVIDPIAIETVYYKLVYEFTKDSKLCIEYNKDGSIKDVINMTRSNLDSGIQHLAEVESSAGEVIPYYDTILDIVMATSMPVGWYDQFSYSLGMLNDVTIVKYENNDLTKYELQMELDGVSAISELDVKDGLVVGVRNEVSNGNYTNTTRLENKQTDVSFEEFESLSRKYATDLKNYTYKGFMENPELNEKTYYTVTGRNVKLIDGSADCRSLKNYTGEIEVVFDGNGFDESIFDPAINGENVEPSYIKKIVYVMTNGTITETVYDSELQIKRTSTSQENDNDGVQTARDEFLKTIALSYQYELLELCGVINEEFFSISSLDNKSSYSIKKDEMSNGSKLYVNVNLEMFKYSVVLSLDAGGNLSNFDYYMYFSDGEQEIVNAGGVKNNI